MALVGSRRPLGQFLRFFNYIAYASREGLDDCANAQSLQSIYFLHLHKEGSGQILDRSLAVRIQKVLSEGV